MGMVANKVLYGLTADVFERHGAIVVLGGAAGGMLLSGQGGSA